MSLFFSSDLHLHHKNILSFEDDNGEKFRGRFSSVEEMNEYIIERHNSVIGVSDKWYCLGDLSFSIKELDILLSRMNGKKRLILGNHDYGRKRDFEVYFKHFEKILESRRMGPLLFTHRPVYIGEAESKVKANVHGHIHEKSLPDSRYLNISVERIDYTPISMDEIIETFKSRGIDVSEAYDRQ